MDPPLRQSFSEASRLKPAGMTGKVCFTVFFSAFLLCLGSFCAAGPKIEEQDLDKDGFKEIKIYYERNVKVKIETDKNKDGKADQIVMFDKDKRVKAEADKNFDGQMDVWYEYDSKGSVARTSKDLNFDGKADSYTVYMDGRNLLIKERDKNFDGKIDERMLDEWDGNKKMTTVVNGNVRHTPMPGYIHLWTEKDTNFDGIVDSYRERKSKNGTKINHPTTLEKPMNQELTPKAKEKEEEKPRTSGGYPNVEQKIKGLNERFGIKE